MQQATSAFDVPMIQAARCQNGTKGIVKSSTELPPDRKFQRRQRTKIQNEEKKIGSDISISLGRMSFLAG